ncbi:MAG TPA: UDP-N-acetylmuramate dehydrogenase [Candidatus Sulfotelmatobacter sp.]|nr:UDP-N-acetylmuramate dehydrogenase [Candidatus Sulfotelmatobacter sp.]
MYIEIDSMVLQENVPLAPLTTFRLGGPARYLVEARSTAEVAEAVAFAESRNLPLFVLGGGSNLVVADEGWPGLVLKVAITGIEQRSGEHQGKVTFEVGAGESWDAFVAQAVAANCAGVECLSGIPGSVGGTPVQNVGAYGQEVSETIESVQVFDRKDGQSRELCNEACGFSYRTSIFNTTERGRFIILRVTYALVAGGDPHIEYGDLRRHFEGRPSPTLAEVRDAVRQTRARKGMLIVDGDPDSRSAGSFFKNPVLTEKEHENLRQRAEARGLSIPSYPALERNRKVSAAWLVEHSGFSRGYALGQAGISGRHALALVNRGGAKAAEIMALKDRIQRAVEDQWGVRLQPEPVFVGIRASDQRSVVSDPI